MTASAPTWAIRSSRILGVRTDSTLASRGGHDRLEIGAEDKAAFLVWYCQHPAYRLRARYALRADTTNLTPTEIDRLARQYPVFGLDPAGALDQGEHADASR